ncbi:MAG: isochorismatase family protein [Hyphomicrobiaceae bacterium]
MANDFEDHCWKDVMPPGMLQVYSHYARKTYLGENPALLAIDLYDLVYQGGPKPVEDVTKEFPSSCGIHAYNAIQPTTQVFAAARAAGLPIIYTTSDTRPDSKPTMIAATARSRVPVDPAVYSIRADFKPQPGDTIITKQRASAFFGTPLIAHLTLLGVRSLIIVGESTSGCVRASAVDAYSHGFHVVLVEECCFDRCELSHKVSLFDLHHKYSDVMHVDQVLNEIRNIQPARIAAQ